MYQIHSDQLSQKGGTLKAVCSCSFNAFKESKDRVYTFKETTTGTVARFVEWAYLGEYLAELPTESSRDDFVGCGKSSEHGENPGVESAAKAIRETIAYENHPLLSHARMYVFGDAYLIEDLKKTAFRKFASQLQLVDSSPGLDLNCAVITLLDYCFSNLRPDDELLDYLGQYTAYRLSTLRVIPDFTISCPRSDALFYASLFLIQSHHGATVISIQTGSYLSTQVASDFFLRSSRLASVRVNQIKVGAQTRSKRWDVLERGYLGHMRHLASGLVLGATD